MRREVIAARGVVTILLIFNSLLYDHLNAINFQSNESHEIPTLHLEDGGFAWFKGVVVEDGGLMGLPENRFYPGFAGDIVLGASEGLIFRDAVFTGYPDNVADLAMKCLMEKVTTAGIES